MKFDQVRLKKLKKDAPKRKIKEIVTPGGYRIPQYLATKPTGEHRNTAKGGVKPGQAMDSVRGRPLGPVAGFGLQVEERHGR